MTPSISVVIPVYNSEVTLEPLVSRLLPVLAAHATTYEIILVNDGSRDHSWDIIRQLGRKHPNLHGINLLRNYGQHNALLCGIRAAQSEVLVTMDDDLQHPPEEIPTLLAALTTACDVVYGAPEHEQHGLWRDLASQLTKLALRSAMGATNAEHVGAFRAFRRNVCDAFAGYHNPFVSIDVLLTWGTTRFAAVRVRHDPRRAGTSNYTFGKLLIHALNMVTGFSVLPLRIASAVGFVFTVFGCAVLLYVIARYVLQGDRVPGFPFLSSIIAIFAGAQLFALGIIGEYLARIHYHSMGRPAYVVGAHTAGYATAEHSNTRGVSPHTHTEVGI